MIYAVFTCKVWRLGGKSVIYAHRLEDFAKLEAVPVFLMPGKTYINYMKLIVTNLIIKPKLTRINHFKSSNYNL